MTRVDLGKFWFEASLGEAKLKAFTTEVALTIESTLTICKSIGLNKPVLAKFDALFVGFCSIFEEILCFG